MPTIIQTFQGRVTGLWGAASMRGADGKMRVLKLGDIVNKGDVILTSPDGIVQLSPDDSAAQALAATRIGQALAPATEIDRVITGLNDANPQDAPAAGLGGDGGGGELFAGLRVDRITEPVTPLGLAQTVTTGNVLFDVRGTTPLVSPELLNPTAATLVAGSASISATEQGQSVGLGLTAPKGTTAAAVITVTQLPLIGQLVKADGSTVAVGTVLTPADLTGLKYLPPADYNGSATVGDFGYTVTDGGRSASGSVAMAVAPVNDAPVAQADSATLLEDTPARGNVLTNDSDVDSPALSVTQFQIGGSTFAAGSSAVLAGVGTLAVNADGSYTFTPALNYNGPVPVATYTVSDGTATSTGTLSLTIAPVNDAPAPANDSAATPINTPVTVAVLANDRDVDGDPLSVTAAVLANPAQGSVTINPDGTLSFTPAANVVGPVVVTYTVADGHGGTATASLTINVGTNSPPDGGDAARTLPEDGSYTVSVADLGFKDTDAGQTLTNVRIDTVPSAGTLRLNGVAVAAGIVISAADVAAGKLVFVPAANGNGAPYASIGFSVQDSAGGFDTTPNTLTLNVTPVNDAPVAVADAGTALEDTPLLGNVLANDSDVDGNALSVTQFVIGAILSPLATRPPLPAWARSSSAPTAATPSRPRRTTTARCRLRPTH